MVRLLIKNADDTNTFQETYVRFSENGKNEEVKLYPQQYRRANNPIIESINDWLKGKLNISRKKLYRNSYRKSRGYYTPSWQQQTEVDKSTNEFSYNVYIGMWGYVIHFNKVKTRYYINGICANKSVLMAALSRTIFKSCFCDDPEELDDFLMKHIKLPELVSYAIENRAPYYFYLKDEHGNNSKRVECRLKVNLIDNNKVAIELSDGMWGELTVKQMNTYMNTYHKKKKQGNWSNLSPAELWERAFKRKPNQSELVLMEAFLNQNRTSKVVRERARDLMIHIASQYSDRVAINWGSPDKLLDQSDNPTIMYVRGKMADWKLTDRGLKTQGQQNVSTYVWVETEQSDLEGFTDEIKMKGSWKGPICVDNLDNKSPTGDQFVTRAMGLLNDNMIVSRVSTIKGYLNKGHVIGQTSQRIPDKVFREREV